MALRGEAVNAFHTEWPGLDDFSSMTEFLPGGIEDNRGLGEWGSWPFDRSL